MAKVLEADVVCWATPIYYYEMSGQMKTLIDRMNAMYPKNYRFRDIYRGVYKFVFLAENGVEPIKPRPGRV